VSAMRRVMGLMKKGTGAFSMPVDGGQCVGSGRLGCYAAADDLGM